MVMSPHAEKMCVIRVIKGKERFGPTQNHDQIVKNGTGKLCTLAVKFPFIFWLVTQTEIFYIPTFIRSGKGGTMDFGDDPHLDVCQNMNL